MSIEGFQKGVMCCELEGFMYMSQGQEWSLQGSVKVKGGERTRTSPVEGPRWSNRGSDEEE